MKKRGSLSEVENTNAQATTTQRNYLEMNNKETPLQSSIFPI